MINGIKRIIVSCLSLVFVVTGTVPALSYADVNPSNSYITEADDRSSKQRIVVSMGDSYSSGEGIEPFYGNPDPDSKDFAEFLAHQSQKCWSGMLELPGVGKMKDHKARTFPDYSYDPNAKLQWYFVASSGAETIDVLGDPEHDGRGQKKEYSIDKDSLGVRGEIHTTYFNPQISVLKFLNKQGVVPDYITLTLGGNDLGFVSIIETAMTKSSYINSNYIRGKLSAASIKLDFETKHKLNEVYHKINDASKIGDKQPCILVAGYPRLLDPTGKGLMVSVDEATWINERVDYFNNVIREEVKKCKDEGLNIEFVDVAGSFGDRGANSENALINGVVPIPRGTDINKYIFKKIDGHYQVVNLASAKSMHPNYEGAKVYAECFQKVINCKEGLTKEPALTPTPKPVEIRVLSDEEALKAVKNYILIELGYDQYNGAAPWYVDIDPKTNSDTAVIYFRAYTGANIYYYVNRLSGETHEKVYTPDMEDGVGEGKDGATFNAWDYLNRTTAETTSETTKKSETSSSASSSASNKPTVKVSNAVNKTYKSKTDSGFKYTWKIPKVTISGKNMDSVNKKIKKELSVKDSDVKYTYFIGDDIVSILVEIQDVVIDGAFFGYKVYNISIKTGKLMSGSAVVKLYKSSDSKFFKLVKKVYDKAWKDNSKKWENGSPEKKWNKKAIKSYKYVFPYINKSGKLCFVAVIAGPPSDDEGWIKYDASKKKYLVDQEGVYKWRSV